MHRARGGERAALSTEWTRARAQVTSAIERLFRVVQPTELQQCPRAPELCVGKLGTLGNDGVIFAQGRCGISAQQSDRGEPDVVLHGPRVGPESGAIRGDGSVEVAAPSPNQTQGVPRLTVSRIPTRRLGQPRFGQLGLAPTRGAQPSSERSQRITRRDLCGVIVLFERFVVAVAKLEGVTQLNPGHRASWAKLLSECLGLLVGVTHLPHA